MKAFTYLSIAAILLFAGPAAAQHHSGKDDGKKTMMTDSTKSMQQGTMMQGQKTMHGEMMHGQMMGMQGMPGYGVAGNMHCTLCMVNQEMMWVNRLPDMQNELSLTDDQVTKLTQLRTLCKKQTIDLNAEVQKQIDLKTLMDQGASGDEIRKVLQSTTDLEIDSAVSTYETAMKMKALLTEQQKKKLEEDKYSTGWMGGQHMMNRE